MTFRRSHRSFSLNSAPVLLAIGLVVGACGAASDTTTTPTTNAPSDGLTIRLVDTEATPETRSLFVYLNDIRGEGILFGHQHATTYGLTIGDFDGTQSDVKNGVGSHPALFGWDTLSIYGHERPGYTEQSVEENIAALAGVIQQAHQAGGIITISTHPWNFLTGNDFYDATSGVVTAILPGGDKNGEFNEYLDDIATLATSVTDKEGNPIPLIFRPFHENNGSWFWWGASQCTSGEYKELYRYTVEYLRDTKGVHNLLYAYSPNGSFGGSEEDYLRTYPGDAFVDILGYDRYDDTAGSEGWLSATVTDLAMVARLADERGKVSAFTEFGVSGALKPNGSNPNLDWFTDLLAAIKSDPDASRSAYMQTWANFDVTQYFVPFPASGEVEEHELLADFREFFQDPYTLFAGELENVWTRSDITTSPHPPILRIVSPPSQVRILDPTYTIRAKLDNAVATRVFFTLGESDQEFELTLSESGYYEGEWEIGEDRLNNQSEVITVVAVLDTEDLAEGQISFESSVILGEKPAMPLGMVDNFEGYSDDASLRDEYTIYQSNTISLVKDHIGEGSNALRFEYDFTNQEYTGVGRRIDQDWSSFGGVRFWYQPDGNDHRLVLQMVANGYYFEAYPSMAGTEPGYIEIPFSDFRSAPWDTSNLEKLVEETDLKAVTEFNIYINQNVEVDSQAGNFIIDDIQAIE